jgi:hypothetical protein
MSRLAGAVLAIVLLLVTLLPVPAHAEDQPGPDSPVRMLLVTSGLSWEDVNTEVTPTLQCLANGAGLGAMNTTSTSVVSTERQGVETLHTGYRGLAGDAPKSAGIPNPPTDQLANLPGEVTEVDATVLDSADATVQITESLEADDGLVIVDLGSIPRAEQSEQAPSLTALDDRLAQVLAAAGVDPSSGDCSPSVRALLVSVAATGPADPDAVETNGPVASRNAGLQVAMDTGHPGQALSSGATHQDGLVVLTDVLPTVLASHQVEPSLTLPGQSFTGVDHDRTQAARLVDAATVPALGSWFALGVIGLALLLIPPTRRRHRVRTVARALLAIAAPALAVGLFASAIPWWRTGHPTLALTGMVWAGSALLAVAILSGGRRLADRWAGGRGTPAAAQVPTVATFAAGLSGLLVAGLVLAESALGSPFQTGSPLGAQPISGGRFYGLSNHLFGIVLAGAMGFLLALLPRLAASRYRVLATIATGLVVAGVCVAPSMGADFGSMLVCVPTFGLLALLVSGIRPRLWHVFALGGGGVVAVLGVSFLDWLRPAAERTHLGRFIDDLISGDLVTVVVRKLSQNVNMVLDYPPLGLLMLVALLLSLALLFPIRFHWRAVAALHDSAPGARAVLIALVVGTWLGYAVNDTGPVLVAAALGVSITLVGPMLSTAEERSETDA